jgi:cytochrome c heme-lyase
VPAHQQGTQQQQQGTQQQQQPGQQQQGQAVWMYPSEQQFFNAMARKGWAPEAGDMPAVVAIHNAVNERAWAHVRAWEALHACECAEPKLLRFRGRPADLSPKARLLNLLGYKLPFDRHDWVVDRCGTEVRYVIDFYSGGGASGGGGVPSMHLDVRPALDSFGAALDRVRMQWRWVSSGRWRDEA